MRAAGFSLTVLRGGVPVQPPGQGRLLLPFRGDVRVREHADPAGRVPETVRPANEVELLAGRHLFALANDASWSIEAADDAVVLSVGTSVPRAGGRRLELGRRMGLRPRLLFANEALRVELLAPVGRWLRPLRGRRATDDEQLVVLRGGLGLELNGDRTEVPPGSLVTIPAGARYRLAPAQRRGAAALLLSPTLDRQRAHRLDREAARGFTPFRR